MKKSIYIIGFITCFVAGIGAMFEFLHWPGSGMIVFAAFLLFNFGLLPMFFYQKYKAVSF